MSRLPLVSTGPVFTDGVNLDGLAEITGLHLVYGPRGPQSASWTFNSDPGFVHRAVQPGRYIYAELGGGVVWGGRLTSPGRGSPWSMQADGITAEALQFQATAPTTGNTLALNEVIDAAIAAGLQWARSGSLPSLTSADGSTAGTVDDALTAVETATGQQARIDWSGLLTMAAPPTSARLVLMAADPAGGRTLDSYSTAVVVTYNDAPSHTVKQLTVSNAAAAATFGARQTPLDLTQQDYMSPAAATAQGNALLATLTPRAGFQTQWTLSKGQVLTLGGVPIDLALMDCSLACQVAQTFPDLAGELDPTVTPTVLLGEVDYDVDADVIAVTPLDVPARDRLLSNGLVA